MKKLSDEYRRNAKECQRMADNARNAADRASWLRLAASWLGMLKGEPDHRQPAEKRPAEGQKSADVDWPNPSDEDSQASH